MSAKIVKKSLGGNNADITKMFNELLSADSANINIAFPKYNKLITHIDDFINVFILLQKSTFMKIKLEEKNQLYINYNEQIEKFLSTSVVPVERLKNAQHLVYYNKILDDNKANLMPVDLTKTDEAMMKAFRDDYKELKTLSIVNVAQITCERLIHYRSDIENIETLDYNFIENLAGVEFKPFPFTNLDYKDLFLDDDDRINNEKTKKYLTLILHKVFKCSYGVYDLISTPDIDVDEFVNVILSSLEKLKKHSPELSRCNKAFAKISQSAQLLKNKFSTYFKDLQETKSPSIMMENFILDIAKDSDADLETMRQFKKIISYYRKMSSTRKDLDPKIQHLFDKVDTHFKQFDDVMKRDGVPESELESSDDEDAPDAVPIVAQSADEIKKMKEKEMADIDKLADEINNINKDVEKPAAEKKKSSKKKTN